MMRTNTDPVAAHRPYDLDRVVRLVLGALSIGVAVYVINYLSGVLLPFLVGGLLAYMLNPLVEWIKKVLRLKGRALASILALVIAITAITLALWVLIPYLVKEFSSMAKLLGEYAQKSFSVPHIPAVVQEFIKKNVDVNELITVITKSQWSNVLNNVANGTLSVLGGTLSVVVSFITLLVVLLYMFFILLDYDKITRGFKGAIPPKYRKFSFRIIRDVEHTMSRYFRGQALVSLFVGIIFAIEFSIIGLPLAIVFGLFIGFLNMVPYLQLISFPIAAFLCLVASVATGGSFWVLFGWTFAAYCICQVIQDLVLIPLIMKQQMGLNPAIIFLALSVWGYVLGFIGLIIALPLTTLIISYYSEWVLHRPNPLYKNDKYKKESINNKRGKHHRHRSRNKTMTEGVIELFQNSDEKDEKTSTTP